MTKDKVDVFEHADKNRKKKLKKHKQKMQDL
jgi:hypothetical protein